MPCSADRCTANAGRVGRRRTGPGGRRWALEAAAYLEGVCVTFLTAAGKVLQR